MNQGALASVVSRATENGVLAMSAVEAQPFPTPPTGSCAFPVAIIRSALFRCALSPRSKRKAGNAEAADSSAVEVVEEEIPAPDGYRLLYSGKRLDQHHASIFLEISDRFRGTVPGQTLFSTQRSILVALWAHNRASRTAREWPNFGKNDYLYLRMRLSEIARGHLAYDTPKFRGSYGTLLLSLDIDKHNGLLAMQMNPRLRWLYEEVTWLDKAQRLSLSTSLSQWLFAYCKSMHTWHPTFVETLRQRSGSTRGRLSSFRADLKESLEELNGAKYIGAWSIDESDKLIVDLALSPTQSRRCGTG